MSISLNNHESRITALENKQNKLFKRVVLFSGECRPNNIAQLSQSMLNFDIIRFILCGTDGSGSLIPNMFVTNVFVDEMQDKSINSISVTGDLSSAALIYLNDRDGYKSCQPYVGGSPYGDYWYLKQVVGILTIYYIVRYNIYKLVLFISHLNIKFGGERR